MNKKIYLVADASEEYNILLPKLKEAIKNGIDYLQLFNCENTDFQNLMDIIKLCKDFRVRCIIYENIELMNRLDADGIHFDNLPKDFLKTNKIVGITVSNQLDLIKNAEILKLDYISFCSVFPTKSATVCELVEREHILRAREYFSGLIFLAGGISKNNINQLKNLQFDGIAVISEIMDAKNISHSIANLKNELSFN
ncbi:MAG: thiamine phosphate synthase [Cruoricaptor ignavus]|nr:thiamine phosphate synthase [Cruoricaptor ignavus]